MVKKTINMFKEAFRNKNVILAGAFAYFLMILSIFLFAKLIEKLIPKDSAAMIQFAQQSKMNSTFIILLVVAYFLIIIFLYAFFKNIIIKILSSSKINKKSLEYLGSFYIFNFLQDILFAVIFLVLGAFISYTFKNYAPISLAYAIIFALIAYPITNISQIIFFKKLKTLPSVKSGVKTLFSNFGKYARIIVMDTVIIGLSLLLFSALGFVFQTVVGKNMTSDQVTSYNLVFVALFSAVVLIATSLNTYLFIKISENSKN